MISKRVTSLFRRITVCLTVSLLSLLFVLSCQKDEGLKQKDSNALTKAQAKEYFENNACTLKFLTAGSTLAGTKNADYSLTENMIIEWDQALEGEIEDSYVVEIPIRMVSPITVLLYDGVGHLNKNIRQVQMTISLLIERHKDDACLNHYLVTTIGSYLGNLGDIRYGYLANKTSFSGYQIFSTADGMLLKANNYQAGISRERFLFTEKQISKIDSLGRDLKFKGISFVFSKGALTKGGGGLTSGEDKACTNPDCYDTMWVMEVNSFYIIYWCPTCGTQTIVYIDPLDTCPVCLCPQQLCICCTVCHYYPCICCDECHSYPCICNPNPEPDPEPDPNTNPEEPEKPEPDDTTCDLCGRQGCDGSCQLIAPNSNWFYLINVAVDSSTPYGTVSKYPRGNYIGAGITVQLTAYPYSGYYFMGWKINGSIVSTQNPYPFYAASNLNIYAVFSAN